MNPNEKLINLFRYLRHRDDNKRYRAFLKLRRYLQTTEYASYSDSILEYIERYSARDPHEKIRSEARKILEIHGIVPPATGSYVKRSNFKMRPQQMVYMGILIILIAVLASMFLSEDEPSKEQKPEVVQFREQNRIGESAKEERKQKFLMKLRVKKGFEDKLDIDIKQKVFFKDKQLFVNNMSFLLERQIKDVRTDGSFVMEEWISRAYGISIDLHNFGYPNPGEKLRLSMNSTGKLLSANIDNKKLSGKKIRLFEKNYLPGKSYSVGHEWTAMGDSLYRFNDVIKTSNSKLLHILHDYRPARELSQQIESSSLHTEYYLDANTCLPMLVRRRAVLHNNNDSGNVNLKSETIIVAKSTNIGEDVNSESRNIEE